MLAGEIFSFQVQKVNITFTLYDIQCSFGLTDDSEAGAEPRFCLLFSSNLILLCDALETKQLLFVSHRESLAVYKAVASQLHFFRSALEGADILCNFVKERKKIITMHSSSKSLKSVPPTNPVDL